MSKKIRKVTVHANTLLDKEQQCGRVQFDRCHLDNIFALLAQLPNVNSLTIVLNIHARSFPLGPLLEVLQKWHLKRLVLQELTFASDNLRQIEVLQKTCQTQTALKTLILEGCTGDVLVMRSFIDNLPNIRELCLRCSTLTKPTMISDFPQILTPHLRSLRLEELSDFDDEKALELVKALKFLHLQELHLTSSTLSEEASCKMALALKHVHSLKKLTLHVDSENIGSCLVHILRNNTTLQEIDLWIHNDLAEACDVCCRIAHVLGETNVTLTSLRLRMDIEVESLPAVAAEAFHVALTANTTLQRLCLDDSFFCYPLSPDTKLLLALNASGSRKLLQETNTSVSMDDWVEAVIRTATQEQSHNAETNTDAPNINLDATFYLLSNIPELTLLALENINNSSSIDRNESTSARRSTNSYRSANSKKEISFHAWKLPRSLTLRGRRTEHNIALSA